MRYQKRVSVILICIALVFVNSGTSEAASRVAKVLTSQVVTGSRQIIYNSGDTAQSPGLWTARIPTKIQVFKSVTGYEGDVNIAFRPKVTGSDLTDLRVTVTLWTIGGKSINDRTIYEWSPVSPTTNFNFYLYGTMEVKPGKYFWVIKTYSSSFQGDGEIKVPLTMIK